MLSKKHPKIYKKLKNLQKHNFEKKKKKKIVLTPQPNFESQTLIGG